MQIGKLRTIITLQKNTPTNDDLNQPVESWGKEADLWARMVTEGGREFYAAQKLNAETSAVFIIRYRKGVDTLKRILLGTRIFEILAVADPDNRHIELQIATKEVV